MHALFHKANAWFIHCFYCNLLLLVFKNTPTFHSVPNLKAFIGQSKKVINKTSVIYTILMYKADDILHFYSVLFSFLFSIWGYGFS